MRRLEPADHSMVAIADAAVVDGCQKAIRFRLASAATGDGVRECRLTNIKAGENKFYRVGTCAPPA
jgi:hypothetical protein